MPVIRPFFDRLARAIPGWHGCWRRAAAAGLILATIAGCATRQHGRTRREAAGPAPDLLDVAAIAPRLDAERAQVVADAGAKPAVRVASASATPGAGPVDPAVSRAQKPGTAQEPVPGPGMPPPSTAPGQIPSAEGLFRPIGAVPGAAAVPGLGGTPSPIDSFRGIAPPPASMPMPPLTTVPPLLPGLPAINPAPGGAYPLPAIGPGTAPSALAGATPATIPQVSAPYAIDLPSALRLADDQNPEIGEARVAILAALAQKLAAYSILAPSLNAGATYHAHTGNLERSSGQILAVSSQSLYVGAGARTVAAETVNIPGVNIAAALTEAIYEPLAARQVVAGARFNATATAFSVLLEVSNLYLDLLGAQAELASWRASATEADEITKVVVDYYLTGQGRKADADRADADRRLFQARIIGAEEAAAVASARLSARLNLDAGVRLEIPNWQVEPLTLIDPSIAIEDLIRTAIARRPDLAARGALIGAAEARLQRELKRPLLPTLWIGYSGGMFGGGSNIVQPSMGHFNGREDFDARVYWTLLNGSLGNVARQRAQRAEVNQAVAERVRAINKARDEVTSARAEALVQRQKVDTARVELNSAEDGYREDRIHLRESLGRPIETLNSLKLLANARINLIKAIIRSNQAQFGLFVSLGSPPPLGPDAGATPSGPPPIPNPLNSPIVSRPVPLIPVDPPGPPLLGK